MSENKKPVTVSMSPELLQRLDAVAESRGESRSQVVERIVFNEIASEERFIRHMESPVERVIYNVLVNTPGLMATVAKIVGDELPKEATKQIREQGMPQQMHLGRQRQAAKRGPKGKAATS